MERLKKLNRVTWAPGGKLCQIKVFSSEDWPSKVGLEAQHRSQLKTSNGICSDGYFTGYINLSKGGHYLNPLKKKNSQIPQIKWKCPPKFALNQNWCVAAGEEGKEAEAQKCREMGVLEAVYPRLSAIPTSPSMSLDVEDCYYDDSRVPSIPITPIEEERAADLSSDTSESPNTCFNSQAIVLPQDLTPGSLDMPPCDPSLSPKPLANEKRTIEMLPGLDGDLLVAAAAALTAIMKTKEQGSLIDTNLLIEFLRNPKMIEKLITERGMGAITKTSAVSKQMPVASSAPVTSSLPDLVKNSTCGYGQVVNTRTVSMSEPTTVTQSVPFASPTPEVGNEKLTNEHGPPGHMGTPLISGLKPITESFHLPSSKPDVMLTKNLINEHGAPVHTGSGDIAGLKPLTAFVSLPNSQPDIETIKRMINDYGAPDHSGNEPMFSSKPEVAVLPKPTSNLSVSSFQAKPNSPQSILHVKPFSPDALVHTSPFPAKSTLPVKDLNYYKTLVKQHGEGQETLNYNPSQFGKPHNYSRGSKVAKDLKASEPKPKYQKPCIYFNSSKGCRNGSSCPFKHEMSKQGTLGGVQETPNAKRLKLGGVITGRT